MEIRFEGIEEVRGFLRRMLDRLRGRGLMSGVEAALEVLADAAKDETHVFTGTLSAAHSWRIITRHADTVVGEVYPRGYYNPHANMLASDYAIYEYLRGGDHEFYRLAFERAQGEATARAGTEIIASLTT